MPDDDRRLVYSTDGTLPLPRYDAPKKSATPRKGGTNLPDDGVVRVGCERRRGGSVTSVYGLLASELDETGKALRRRCGTGGTTKAGIVELQGDHRDAIVAYFGEKGRRVKKMGG